MACATPIATLLPSSQTILSPTPNRLPPSCPLRPALACPQVLPRPITATWFSDRSPIISPALSAAVHQKLRQLDLLNNKGFVACACLPACLLDSGSRLLAGWEAGWLADLLVFG